MSQHPGWRLARSCSGRKLRRERLASIAPPMPARGSGRGCPCIVCVRRSRCAAAGSSALLLTNGRRRKPSPRCRYRSSSHASVRAAAHKTTASRRKQPGVGRSGLAIRSAESHGAHLAGRWPNGSDTLLGRRRAPADAARGDDVERYAKGQLRGVFLGRYARRASPIAMDVYFSHSYRDFGINGYFLGLFVDETIALQADQKTDVWCVAKLERYVRETAGFVSVIPARPTDDDPGGYSPYIGQELLLARRARVPRLLFVDDRVLARHRVDFPEDAVPFDAESVEGGQAVHARAIRAFGARLETYYRAPAEPPPHEAVVIAGDTNALRHAAEDVVELLRRAGFGATQLRASLRSLDV